MGWNDIKQNSGSNDKPDVNYLSLGEGTHQIRILSEEPYTRWTHWVQSANGGKGLTVNCIGKNCPICSEIKAAKANKEKPKYNSRKLHALNVIDRKTGEVAILDKGNALFEQLLGLFEEIGDPREYDVKIRVSGTGRDTSYVVIPMPATKLTDAEKALEQYDFDEIYTNLTPEQIQQLIDGATYADIFGDKDNDDDEPDVDIPEVDFMKD